MNRSIACAMLILVLAATATDARKKIVNFEKVAIPEGLSLAQVERAITTGIVDRSWIPKVLAPGHVEAALLIRSHTAIIDIKFDESTYSITYRDSINLDYKNGKIHRSYNRWVANLNLALLRRLSSVTPGSTEPSSERTLSATVPDAATPASTPAAQGTYAGETATISASIDLAESVNAPPAYPECQTGTQLSSMLEEQSRIIQIGSVPSAGHYMDLAITQLHMPGGGGWSGPKWLEVTGTLHEGNGDIVASFRAKRFSTGGAFAAYKGTCRILRRCTQAIAVDIADWLKNPIDGAELGDAR